MIDPLFQFHRLNTKGVEKGIEIAEAFSEFLARIEEICNRPGTSGTITLPRHAMNGRHLAIVRTNLEEACFHAKKAMAVLPENQDV